MADRLLVSTEVLEAGVQKFNASQKEVEDALNALRSAAYSTEGNWTGDASNAFISAFDRLYDGVKKAEVALEIAATGLKAISVLAEESESQNQSVSSAAASLLDSL